MKTRWYKNAVVYQIYPYSFKDSNNDGIGDIKGIMSKLDYLSDLGISAIWFSPLYDSPDKDFGYDIRDYYKIAPHFGTMEEFDQLVKMCHERGIKVIMDMVLNHTSNEHEWFKKALHGDKKYRDYYIIRKGVLNKDKMLPPNNYASCFTGSAWERIGDSDEFYLHLFTKEQPDLNWDNAEVRKEAANILNFYLKKGVDGFRFDVFNLFSKTEGLPNGKKNVVPKGGEWFIDGPHIHEYLKELSSASLNNFDSFSVGESFSPSDIDKKKYVSEEEGELDSIFDFSHLSSDSLKGLKYIRKPFDFVQYKKGLLSPQMENEGIGWNTLVLENHDVPRSLSRFGINSTDYRYEAATMLCLTTFLGKGTPFIYQGEEAGLLNSKFDSIDEYIDPVSHFIYNITKKMPIPDKARLSIVNYGARDHARVPLAWDDSVNGGFNDGAKTWTKVNPNYNEINIKKDMESELSVYSFYKDIISLKKTDEVLINGTVEEFSHKNKSVIVYTRTLGIKKYLIIGNFTDKDYEYQMPDELLRRPLSPIISNYDENMVKDKVLYLAPYEAILFEMMSEEKESSRYDEMTEKHEREKESREKSYGAVLYRIENGEIEYLIEKMTLGHVSLPKGHIEEGESIEECVRREIKEELNLDIDLDMTKSHTITYSPKEGILKDVTFYTARPVSDRIITQKEEVAFASWVSFDSAMVKLTYDDDKDVLEDLNDYILEKERL